METGHDWLGGGDCMIRPEGPVFSGEGSSLMLNWRAVTSIRFP